jgi:uncharacterized phage protein (TIGR02220 family)
MEEEKPNYYAIIPANVRYDENLKLGEKMMYGEITALSNKTGICYASNNYFARLYKVSPQAISKWIKALENNRYITISYEKNGEAITKRAIEMVSTDINRVSTTVDRGINYSLEGYQQEIKENNININNTSINNKKEIYKERWDCDAYVKQLTDGVVSYLNEKSERNFRSNNSKTESLVRARLKEGWKEVDFLQVIEKKCKDWLNTDMEKYLRPETLFGNKFENYINERRRK